MAAKAATRNELVPMSDDNFLAKAGPVIITERSFAFTAEATEETALDAARAIRRVRGMAWILGDMLIAAEGRFPDIYEQMEHETGFDYQTLANAKSLCKRFPDSLRLWDLTPSFYEVVTPCEDREVKKYLDMAVAKGFARDDFRDYVKEERREAQKQANKAAGVGTGEGGAGAAGVGTGKVAAIKVVATPQSLATVALDHLTQEQRGELASLVLANTTADQTKVQKYDLSVADQFPLSMLIFAIERRVAKYDEMPTGAALLKAVKACGKLAERFENDDAPTPAAGKKEGDKPAGGKPAGKPARKDAGSPEKAGAGKGAGQATPAPKAAGKGKGKASDKPPAEKPEADTGDPDNLPVRDLSETEGDHSEGDKDAAALEAGSQEEAGKVVDGDGALLPEGMNAIKSAIETGDGFDGETGNIPGFPPGYDPNAAAEIDPATGQPYPVNETAGGGHFDE